MDNFDLSLYVRGEVIDIRDPLCASVDRIDKILVDTNVLYWFYYTRSSQLAAFGEAPRAYQLKDYPDFLKKLLSSRAVLLVHGITLVEFTNLVMKAELMFLYSRVKNTLRIPKDLNFGKFRRDYPTEYFSIQRNLQTYLYAIMKKFKLLGRDVPIDRLMADFLLKWQDSLADVWEAMMFADAECKKIYCILSDDAYISTIEGVCLYTANKTAIDAYKKKQSSYAQTDPQT